MKTSAALTRKLSQTFALALFGAPLALIFFAVFWNVNALVSDRSYNPDTLAPPVEAVSVGKVVRNDRPALNFLAAKLEAFGRQGEFAAAVRSGNEARIRVWLDGLRRWSPILGKASVGPTAILDGGASTVSRNVNTGDYAIAVPIADFRNVQAGTLIATVPSSTVTEIGISATAARPLTTSVTDGNVPVVYAPALAGEGAQVRTAATTTLILLVLAALTAFIIYRSTQYVAAYVEALIGRAASAARRTIPVPVSIIDASLVALDGGAEGAATPMPKRLTSQPRQSPRRKDAQDQETGRRAA